MMLNVKWKKLTLKSKYLINWTLEQKKPLIYKQLSELLTIKLFKNYLITINVYDVSRILPEINVSSHWQPFICTQYLMKSFRIAPGNIYVTK